jgi:hypothetical protein
MNADLSSIIPFVEAIQKQSHTVEITLDRPHCSQSSGMLDTFLSGGNRAVLRGVMGTLWYAGAAKVYEETIAFWLSPEDLYIELAPHESPLPLERFPIQDCEPLPYGLSIRGTGFTAMLSLSPYRRPARSTSPADQVRASR